MQSKRIASAVVTAALTATAAAVPATAWAAPEPPPAKAVPVDGGLAKIEIDAKLLDALKVKGVVLTQLTAGCQIPKDEAGKPYLPPVTSLSLGVKAGDIASVEAKVGGKVAFADTCLGLVNSKDHKAVVVKNLSADLNTGAIVATLQSKSGASEVKLGTFERPKLDDKTVDVASNTVELDSAVTIDADLAAKINADLGVELLVGGARLLTLDSDLSLDNAANLAVDLNLDLGAQVDTNLDLGAVLGGLLGGGK
ncbi:hypothetical protein ACFQVC_38805 [Streptomyces monticola]|uniref:Cholesterol esterase n=1 Tax=Streptomyces monticola TaxID=2666263 RepID=A0ABW2JXA0_9ACTN